MERIAGLINQGGAHQVVTANPEIILKAQRDLPLWAIIRRSALVTADGIGVVWAARHLGTPLPERVTGIDLMTRLLARAAQEGWPVYLVGSAPGVAATAADRLTVQYPGLVIAGTHHGYFTPAESSRILAAITQAGPALLFAGLGAPKQEKWLATALEQLNSAYTHDPNRLAGQSKPAPGLVAMGIGGSLDVFSGRVRRAPGWMQRLHLEWLYRLLAQPSRIWRQASLLRFVWEVRRQKKNRAFTSRG